MKQDRRNISILFFTLIVVMLGFGMVIPILPFYIKHLGASGSALGMLMATYAIMQFLFAPIWGNISDQYGRKPILLLGVLGNVLAQLLYGLSTQLWMLFAARILAGVLSSATLPTAMAYISDSTSREERGSGMGMLGAAMGIGMVLGPGISGWLATRSLSAPFFLAAFLSTVAFFLVMSILPESLQMKDRKTKGKLIQGRQFREMWQALFGPIGLLLFMAFLLSFGLTNFESVFGLFALEKYQYGPREVGILLTVIGLISAIVQGVLTGPLTKRWGEVRLIRLSLLGSAIGFPLMLTANTSLTILLTMSFFIISNAMLHPVVASLTSKRTTGGQGATMGLNNGFMSLGRSIGPLWAGFAFDINLNIPYLSGGLIYLIGFAISLVWLTMNSSTDAVEAVHVKTA